MVVLDAETLVSVTGPAPSPVPDRIKALPGKGKITQIS